KRTGPEGAQAFSISVCTAFPLFSVISPERPAKTRQRERHKETHRDKTAIGSILAGTHVCPLPCPKLRDILHRHRSSSEPGSIGSRAEAPSQNHESKLQDFA